jgi:hypothetical protein
LAGLWIHSYFNDYILAFILWQCLNIQYVFIITKIYEENTPQMWL